MGNPGYFTSLNLSSTPEFPQNKYPEIWADNLRLRNAIAQLQAGVSTTDALISVTLPTSVAIPAGRFVTIKDLAGVPSVGLCSTPFNPCRGFSPNAIGIGETGTIILHGVITGLTGLSSDGTYYISATPGILTLSAPSIDEQAVGHALSTTTFYLNPELRRIRGV